VKQDENEATKLSERLNEIFDGKKVCRDPKIFSGPF
jgi:hypothetical protein